MLTCQLCEYQSVMGITTSPGVTVSPSWYDRPAYMPIPAPGMLDGARYTPHFEFESVDGDANVDEDSNVSSFREGSFLKDGSMPAACIPLPFES